MTEPYYRDEFVTLYLGDCLEITEWLAADVLVTDPPYGIGWPTGRLHRYRAMRDAATPCIVGDESVAVRDAALNMWNGPSVVFGSWRKPPTGRVPDHRLIWYKAGRYPGVSPHPWYSAEEEIWLFGTGWVGSPTPTVLMTSERRSNEPARIGHPTPKPVSLMSTLIAKCPPGAVADPFVGSGSTLVAAKALGRKAIGVELEERYCEIAARRLAQDVLDFGTSA